MSTIHTNPLFRHHPDCAWQIDQYERDCTCEDLLRSQLQDKTGSQGNAKSDAPDGSEKPDKP